MLQAGVVAHALTVASLLLGPPAATEPPLDVPLHSTDSAALELEPPAAPPLPEPPAPAPPAPPATATLPGPEVEPEGPVPPAEPRVDPHHERLGCQGSASCVRLSATGIAFGSVAVASIVGGVVLYTRPDEVLADEPAYVESTRPPGVVLMTIGTGVAMSSALMLVAAYRGARTRGSSRNARLRLRGHGMEVAF